MDKAIRQIKQRSKKEKWGKGGTLGNKMTGVRKQNDSEYPTCDLIEQIYIRPLNDKIVFANWIHRKTLTKYRNKFIKYIENILFVAAGDHSFSKQLRKNEVQNKNVKLTIQTLEQKLNNIQTLEQKTDIDIYYPREEIKIIQLKLAVLRKYEEEQNEEWETDEDEDPNPDPRKGGESKFKF